LRTISGELMSEWVPDSTQKKLRITKERRAKLQAELETYKGS